MDLFKLVGTIAIDNAGANRELEETSSIAKKSGRAFEDTARSGEESSSKFGAAMKKVGTIAGQVGKTVAVGLGAAAAAVGALTIKALNLSGELEQNMGGSEAVFGEHAAKMQEIAKNAFSNMGLSTSDFLATANKMGALFQGAGFDIKESATMSTQAMQRAADVASIMGIDTTAAMEAIAGAAKGNFTMMDNLGVAMNDTTLNAYALSKGIDKTTKDMTNQEKIGLAMQMFMEKTAYAAGNYAKENETLAGSLTTAKAALTNFLDGSGNVDQLVDSFTNAAKVIVENIKTIAPRLIEGIVEIINRITEILPGLIQELLPTIVNGAVSLIQGVVAAAPALIQALLNILPQLIEGILLIVEAIIQQLPSIIKMLLSALIDLIPQLISGIVNLVVMIFNNIDQIVQPIIDMVPTLILTLVKSLMDNLPLLLSGIINLVVSIAEQTPVIIQSIVDMLPQLIEMILTALLKCLPQILAGIGKIVWSIVKSLPQILGSLVEGIVNIFKGIWAAIKNVFGLNEVGGWFKNVFSKAKEAIFNAWNNVKEKFSNIWNGVKNVFANVGSWFKDTFNKAKENAVNAWNNVKQKFSEKWNNIKNAFSNVGSWFKDTFSKAKDGAVNAWSNIKQKFTDVKNKIVDAFADIKEKLSAPFKKAGDKIKEVVDKIKEWFANIKIKLPHFKIEGKFSLSPLSVPKLKIDWYAKAMDNPMIMNKPTIFGYNPASNSFMGGGEAGSEMVGGTNTVMNMIKDAVIEQNNGLASYLQQLVEILADYFPQVLSNMDRELVFDDGTMAAKLAPAMNVELGRIKGRKDRGR